MAPLPQNNTDRVFFDYVTGLAATSRVHTLAVRRIAPATVDVVQQRLLAVLQAWGAANIRQGWRVTGVRLQSAGTNFSIPQLMNAGLAAFTGTYSGAYASRYEAVESTFQGRSGQSGRRVDISLYFAAADAAENFRITGATSGTGLVVRNVVNALQLSASGDGAFVCIDGTIPTWYDYMNQNYNSYWESRSRTT